MTSSGPPRPRTTRSGAAPSPRTAGRGRPTARRHRGVSSANRCTVDRPGGIVGDLARPAAARRVAEQAGTLDHAVVSIGGWWSGADARDLGLATFDEVLRLGLHPHLVAAQALLPLLDGVDGATYLMLNGGGALAPVTGSSAVVVSAAAQLMLSRSLAVEQPATGALVRAVVEVHHEG